MTSKRGGPLVVEFVGLPGSGKLTICRALHDQKSGAGLPYIFGVQGLRNRLHKNRSISYRASLVISAMAAIATLPLLHLRLLWFGVRASHAHRQVLTFARQCGHLAYEIDRFKADPRCAGLTLVLDQGLLQTIASLSVPGEGHVPEPGGVADRLIANRLDRIVWLDCDQSLSMGRLQKRTTGASRFDEGDGRLGRSQYARFGVVLDRLRDHLGQREVPLLVLNANAPSAANAAGLDAFLTEG